MPQSYLKKIIISFGFLGFFSILILTGGTSLFWNAIALSSLMIYFWILEVIPIYVTALFPLLFASPLGLIDTAGLAKAYGNNMVYLFLGGFILALALEKWGIHLQIARRILRVVGNSKPRILLGFLLSTGLLSMWVSNTATALMMLPMAVAINSALPSSQQSSKFALFLLLSVAYGSSIGGIATLVGSPPNLQMASILSSEFDIQVDFITWFSFGFPVSILLLFAAYCFFYVGLGSERKESVEDFSVEKEVWTKNQKWVLFVFILVVLLWSFKDLIEPFIGVNYSDASAALVGVLLLFLIPTDTKLNLLEWKDTEKLPWGILLLFGGGLALAEALSVGGVIQWLAGLFKSLQHSSYILILLVVVFLAIYLTEVISNLALVTILIPVVAQFANDFNYPVLQLCMSITMAASCAFMLPIGTPPNAIVFSAGHISIKQMAKVGFWMNLISVLLIVLFSYLFIS
jgi:sodium-dependent dicarboxylate transporter 2/3/5